MFALFALLLLEARSRCGHRIAERGAPYPHFSVAPGELRARLDGVPRMSPVWTDVPDWTAWHLDRAALLLPRWRQMDRLDAACPAGAILLSPDVRARNQVDGEVDWVRAIDTGDSIPKWESRARTGAAPALPTTALIFASPRRAQSPGRRDY